MKAKGTIRPKQTEFLGEDKGWNVNFNIVETEGAFEFDYVVVDKLDRGKIIEKIIQLRYENTSNELAIINNKDIDDAHREEYEEYQRWRSFAKSIASTVII